MKIVAISNFDNEMVPDRLIEENLTREQALKKCEERNNKVSENGDYYWVVKEDNYQLYEFKP